MKYCTLSTSCEPLQGFYFEAAAGSVDLRLILHLLAQHFLTAVPQQKTLWMSTVHFTQQLHLSDSLASFSSLFLFTLHFLFASASLLSSTLFPNSRQLVSTSKLWSTHCTLPAQRQVLSERASPCGQWGETPTATAVLSNYQSQPWLQPVFFIDQPRGSVLSPFRWRRCHTNKHTWTCLDRRWFTGSIFKL